MSSTAVPDRGFVTKDLNICLITFSTIFIAVRCYVRRFMLDSVGWDDGFAVIAWVSTAPNAAVTRARINVHSHQTILIVQSALEICGAQLYLAPPALPEQLGANRCIVQRSITAPENI